MMSSFDEDALKESYQNGGGLDVLYFSEIEVTEPASA